ADLTPEQRRDFAPAVANDPVEALVVALEEGKLCAAAWGQRQPGSTSILWPPRFASETTAHIGRQLVEAVVVALDAAGIRMTQVLVQEDDSPLAAMLRSAGFSRLTELQYLTWEAAAATPLESALEFKPYHDSQRARLAALVEATYEATQDCPALGGRRPLDEVIDGYRATGTHRPENWLFVHDGSRDVGVLLLTDHEAAQHWELLYMGLIPEARGRQLGRAVVRYAQALASAAGAERIVLAVDAENIPAIKMYSETGFVAWDRREVYVRFADGDAELRNPS
ncbi:MAG: GNAT family N-acetyltransferase, partial [Pirellulales bacterium]